MFYPLLGSIDSNDVVTQEARVREIDNEIFKYVGVAGVDRPRIVQVGNALAFEEQAALADTYVSPVMTAVTAAFDEPDLFGDRRTSEYDEIRMVFEGILGQHMIVQATLVDSFLAGAERAGWPAEAINERLQRWSGCTRCLSLRTALRAACLRRQGTGSKAACAGARSRTASSRINCCMPASGRNTQGRRREPWRRRGRRPR